jgi:peptide/nickel transport system ATP-binding protein
MIFQEPMTALNPVFTIGEQVGETLRRHRSLSRSEARVETIQLLNRVALPNPSSRFHSYPHELSGGMRQRVMIAMAVASDPRVLIADEPTTALDVQTQRGVLDLLQSVVQAEGIGLLLITHDMALVGERADRICVLCQGRVCEMGDVEPVLSEPLHPYTRGLIACTPRLDGCRGDLPIMASALLSEEAWGPSPALQEGGQRLEPWRPPGDPVGGYHLQEVSDGRFVGVIPS